MAAKHEVRIAEARISIADQNLIGVFGRDSLPVQRKAEIATVGCELLWRKFRSVGHAASIIAESAACRKWRETTATSKYLKNNKIALPNCGQNAAKLQLSALIDHAEKCVNMAAEFALTIPTIHI